VVNGERGGGGARHAREIHAHGEAAQMLEDALRGGEAGGEGAGGAGAGDSGVDEEPSACAEGECGAGWVRARIFGGSGLIFQGKTNVKTKAAALAR
jgi:hypothetical protein